MNVYTGRDLKYSTMGKRVAYQRMMGKDWEGRSLSLGNLVGRVRYLLEKEKEKMERKNIDDDYGNDVEVKAGQKKEVTDANDKWQRQQVRDGNAMNTNDSSDNDSNGDGDLFESFFETESTTRNNGSSDDDNTSMMLSLSQRLLELEIKEAQMEIAECEQQLTIYRTAQSNDGADNNKNSNNNDPIIGKNDLEDVDNLAGNDQVKSLENARSRLQVAQSSLRELRNAVLSQSMTSLFDEADNKPPSILKSVLPFSFPWEDKQKVNNDDDANASKKSNSNTKTQSLIVSILDRLAEQKNPPPYRGAIGYPAKLDTKEEMFQESILPYSSPYDLMLDIINEQLNSEVIGCVLEQTSLFTGNLVLGGALLLKRKGRRKTTTIIGEEVSYTDDKDDFGNEGVLPQSMYVVECFSDEAIGMAMAAGLPIHMERDIWERAGSVSVELDFAEASKVKMEMTQGYGSRINVMDRLPILRPLEGFEFLSQVEGERVSSQKQSNTVRIPLTTNPQPFDDSDEVPQSSSPGSGRSVFSTFNPVESLDEYDALDADGKARILLKLESFRGELPRPRAVRASLSSASNEDYDKASPPSLLDNILLPLIDESVRRQFLIRDAERRKDFNEANALREAVSPRQLAMEEADAARKEGREEDALRLKEEAELYKALRADVTQDEGAYSRYLDRDEWYERETQARIKRLKKSKGIE